MEHMFAEKISHQHSYFISLKTDRAVYDRATFVKCKMMRFLEALCTQTILYACIEDADGGNLFSLNNEIFSILAGNFSFADILIFE